MRLSGRIAAVLIAAGMVLRLAFLGVDSLWLDEAFSVTAVQQHSFREAWTTSLDPAHPPLFFAVLWPAVRALGASEAVARLPSALASVCNLMLLFALAKRLGSSQRTTHATGGE